MWISSSGEIERTNELVARKKSQVKRDRRYFVLLLSHFGQHFFNFSLSPSFQRESHRFCMYDNRGYFLFHFIHLILFFLSLLPQKSFHYSGDVVSITNIQQRCPVHRISFHEINARSKNPKMTKWKIGFGLNWKLLIAFVFRLESTLIGCIKLFFCL